MKTFRFVLFVLTASLVSVAASGYLPVDITYLGTPSQTTTHAGGYVADFAVDGDPDTFSHTVSDAAGSAWMLDFDEEHPISRVELMMRVGCCDGRLNGADLQLFDGEWEQVFAVPVDDNGAGTVFAADVPEGTVSQHLRVGFDSGEAGIVHLAEVRVFSGWGQPPEVITFDATPSNVTSGGSVQLTWSATNVADVLITGLGTVAPAGEASVHSSSGTTYSLVATNPFGAVTAFDSVRIDGQPKPPRISEFMAYPNPNVGPDWIEVWNPDSVPVDLTGWHLTDDPLVLTNWTFPPLVLQPGETVVVGAGEAMGGSGLVAPFGLAREEGSYLALVNPAGAVAHAYTYPLQDERAAYGIDFDGDERFLLNPTPGTVNWGPSARGFLPGVTFSVTRGFYDEPFTLEITSLSPGTPVYYSANGSPPVPGTPHTRAIYGPVTVDGTRIVRAATFADGYVASRPESHTYIFPDQVLNQPRFPGNFPDDWHPPGATGALAPIPLPSDYTMDPRITEAAPFTDMEGHPFDMRDALMSIPTYCLSLPTEEMWDPDIGLHANARLRGRDWEREAGFEIIDPASTQTYHSVCGLRIHGGRTRVEEMLKKSFRLYFRGEYGARELEFPVFDGQPPGGLDHLVLRGGTGKAWDSPWRDLEGQSPANSLERVTYLRDQFLRDAQGGMGNLQIGGTMAHLFINGLYWGLYNAVERPSADHLANHLGGTDDDYDLVRWAGNVQTTVAGTKDVWDELMVLGRGNPADLANYAQVEARLDVDNFIDHMLLNFWVGNADWVVNNAYTYRPRLGDGRHGMLCWDGEEILVDANRNSTGYNTADTFTELHQDLTANLEYRVRFGDRTYWHVMREAGVLTASGAQALHDRLARQIDRAIVCESARWGDPIRPDQPYTRDDWLSELSHLSHDFFANRPALTVTQLRARGLYPNLDPPVFVSQRGGRITADYELLLELPPGQSGTILYTTDGTDPRERGGGVAPSAQVYPLGIQSMPLVSAGSAGGTIPGATWRFLDDGSDLGSSEVVTGHPDFDASDWKHLQFDDTGWGAGPSPLGYGTINGTVLQTVVGYGTDPNQKYITSYFRHAFTAVDPSSFTNILLRVLRDDGIVVYLNGHEVARSNMPVGVRIDATTLADATVGGAEESLYHTIEVPLGMVVDGANVLAVEVHQRGPDSSDLGLDLELQAAVPGLSGNPVTFTNNTMLHARVLSGAEWSPLEEALFILGDRGEDLVVSEIMYHPTDPTPGEWAAGFHDDDDFEYLEIRNVGFVAHSLGDIRFTKGVDFSFSGSAVSSIGPGDIALVVANEAAFEMRYGADLPVAGTWEAGDRLNNGGERLKLTYPDGSALRDFTFDDVAPWPTSPDGGGYSLVLINPFSRPDHGDPYHWRPSLSIGGTPGGHDGTYLGGDPGADLDGDGRCALVEHAMGTSEAMVDAPGETPALRIAADGYLTVTLPWNLAAEDVALSLESSTNLLDWTTADGDLAPSSVVHGPDGTAKLTLRSVAPVSDGPWFLRLRFVSDR